MGICAIMVIVNAKPTGGKVFKKTKLIAVLAMGYVAACFLSSRFLWYSSAFAYSATITTGNSISLDVSPAGDATSIHSESVNVVTDCRSGYNLTIATPEGSDLYRYENDTASGVASFTAVDGVSALKNDNNENKWGYTLSSNPTSATVFSPLSTSASVLKTVAETASPSADINDTFDISYGVRASDEVAPGSYQMANHGAIVYYLTMDALCTHYTVSFNANGGTTSDTIPEQSIPANEPTRLNSASIITPPSTQSYVDADNNTITGVLDKLWTFWGWNTAADGTGDWYKDRESVTGLASVGGGITLYAQWKQATFADMVAAPATQPTDPKQINHNEMQDMSPEICWNSDITTSVNAPGVTLLDYRGKVTSGDNPEAPGQYTVSKLPDGLCWMTQNLNLGRKSGGANNDGSISLDANDTDLTDGDSFTLPASTSTESTGVTAPRIRSGANANGVYYSWAAAIASTTVYDSSEYVVTSSVCPKNWDLPTDNQYINLKTKADYKSGNPTTAAPGSFVVNGGFTNGVTFYQTGYGFYWSSVVNNANTAFGVRVNGTTIVSSAKNDTTYGGNKYYEKNVRCVAGNGRATIHYAGNGSDGAPGNVESQVDVELNSTNSKPSTSYTKAGYGFVEWNTAADGSGKSIAADTTLSALNLKPGEIVTLYAQWVPQFTITYVNNCLTWAANDANCTNAKSITTSQQIINLDNSGDGSGTLGDYNKFNNVAGWKIREWSTNADGSGSVYPVKTTYAVTGAAAGDGVTLYAHWVKTYTLQYDGNGADNASTGMGSTNATTGVKTVAHTGVAEGDVFTLFASNFKRAGYGFVGWSTDSDAWTKITDNNASNDPKIWGPNEPITAPSSAGSNVVSLFAIWAPAEKDINDDPVYLQGWTGCTSMYETNYDSTDGTFSISNNTITALTDERDGQVYAIAKLADGNCWMIENLRLADAHEEEVGGVLQSTPTVLSVSNTNILSTNSTLPITNIYNADASLATKSNSLSTPSSVAYNASSAIYGWCTTNSVDCYDQSRLDVINTTSSATPSKTQAIAGPNSHTDFNVSVYSYGNYYNWYSATVGYGLRSKASGQVDGDICPNGWHLPYGGGASTAGNTSGGFYYLSNASGLSSKNLRIFPNNLILSGYRQGASAADMGKNGYYWSATAYSATDAYDLSLTTTTTASGGGHIAKYRGAPVRCVADVLSN